MTNRTSYKQILSCLLIIQIPVLLMTCQSQYGTYTQVKPIVYHDSYPISPVIKQIHSLDDCQQDRVLIAQPLTDYEIAKVLHFQISDQIEVDENLVYQVENSYRAVKSLDIRIRRHHINNIWHGSIVSFTVNSKLLDSLRMNTSDNNFNDIDTLMNNFGFRKCAEKRTGKKFAAYKYVADDDLNIRMIIKSIKQLSYVNGTYDPVERGTLCGEFPYFKRIFLSKEGDKFIFRFNTAGISTISQSITAISEGEEAWLAEFGNTDKPFLTIDQIDEMYDLND